MVLPLMVFMAKSALIRNYNLSSITFMWVAAAPLDDKICELVHSNLCSNTFIIRRAFGMTEISMIVIGQTEKLLT